MQKSPQGFAPVGSSIAHSDQLIVTEDSIQVLEIQIVSLLLANTHPLPTKLQNNLDDGDHPFHLHGHRPWMYVAYSLIFQLTDAMVYSLGVGAGQYIGQALNNTNPLRRDTLVIPAYSYLVLRFVTDNREYHVTSSHSGLTSQSSWSVGIPLPHGVAYGCWSPYAVQQPSLHVCTIQHPIRYYRPMRI